MMIYANDVVNSSKQLLNNSPAIEQVQNKKQDVTIEKENVKKSIEILETKKQPNHPANH